MRRTMLKSKIHRATVTQADLHYEGSVTIDDLLLRAADIIPNEKVSIWNITNGSRFDTYALRGQAGSGVVCVNGAAARLVSPGDLVIIASYVEMDEQEAHQWEPHLVFVDERNRIKADAKTVRLA
ncbi:MAG: aspartate 1-decarboxylase [Myxococcales bacterium]|nr:aspartate 1-decarboxylase [Myxococcales bacterium]